MARGISLRLPIVSSPMDTVTESAMAAALASVGSMGFIHYNNTVEEQVSSSDEINRGARGVTGHKFEPSLSSQMQQRSAGDLHDATKKKHQRRSHGDA